MEWKKGGANKGRGQEPQLTIKKVDYKNLKEGGKREEKPTGEQSWNRLASLFESP